MTVRVVGFLYLLIQSVYGAPYGFSRQNDAVTVEAAAPVSSSSSSSSSSSGGGIQSTPTGTDCIYRHYFTGFDTRDYHQPAQRVSSNYIAPQRNYYSEPVRTQSYERPSIHYIKSSSYDDEVAPARNTITSSYERPSINYIKNSSYNEVVTPARNTQTSYERPSIHYIKSSSYDEEKPRISSYGAAAAQEPARVSGYDSPSIAPALSSSNVVEKNPVTTSCEACAEIKQQSAYGISQTSKRHANNNDDTISMDANPSYEGFWMEKGGRMIMGYRQVRRR